MHDVLGKCGWFVCQEAAGATQWWNNSSTESRACLSGSMLLTLTGHLVREGQRLLLSAWEPGKSPSEWGPEFLQEVALSFDCALLWAVAARQALPFEPPPPSGAMVAAQLVRQAQSAVASFSTPDVACALLRLEAVRSRLLEERFYGGSTRGWGFEDAQGLLVALAGLVAALGDDRCGFAMGELKTP